MSYCTSDEVNNLFGDISDDVSDEMLETVILNSDAWIDSNLRKNYVPIPDDVPNALRTASIYYSASDILLSLYHGEEMPVQYDIWFQKAQGLLDAYIDEYLNSEATPEEQTKIQMVKHSHSQTYNERRGRWVR